MAKAKKAVSELAKQAQQANPAATESPKEEQVVRGTLVKTLAKELGVTGKKLRRYLRAQKFQRSGKLWDLSKKQVEEVRGHFQKTEKAEQQ